MSGLDYTGIAIGAGIGLGIKYFISSYATETFSKCVEQEIEVSIQTNAQQAGKCYTSRPILEWFDNKPDPWGLQPFVGGVAYLVFGAVGGLAGYYIGKYI
jgi:hypothetical protein